MYARDPHVIDQNDQFAWSKRTNGFVPWSMWYKEETANAARKSEVSFFADNWGDRAVFKSALIQLPGPYEITAGDLYDLRHRIGLFTHVPKIRLTEKEEIEVLRSFGYKVQAPHRVSIRIPAPYWPPIPINFEHAVNEIAWFAAHPEEARIREKLLAEKVDSDRLIVEKCFLCAKMKRTLAFRASDGCYVHTGIVMATARRYPTCQANSLHLERGTIAEKIGQPYKIG